MKINIMNGKVTLALHLNNEAPGQETKSQLFKEQTPPLPKRL